MSSNKQLKQITKQVKQVIRAGDDFLFREMFYKQVAASILQAAKRFDGFWDFLTFHHRAEFLNEALKQIDAPGKFLIYAPNTETIPMQFDVVRFGQVDVLSFEISMIKNRMFDVYVNDKHLKEVDERDFVPFLLDYCKGEASKAIPVTNGFRKIGQKNVKLIRGLGRIDEEKNAYDLSLVEFKYGKMHPAGFPKRAIQKKVRTIEIEEVHMLAIDEAQLIRRCNQLSKHFIELLGVSYSKGTSIFMNCGISSLYCFLTANRGRLGQAIKLRWTVQAAEALTTLKDIGILHGNLRSKHCFVSEDGNLKIGGFDSAGAATTDEFIHDDPNIKWLAPESLWMKKYNFKSEVWSFGVLIWEIYAEGAEPFRRISDSQVKIKMSRRFQKRNGQHITGFSLNMPKRTPRPVSSLIESCWSHCQCCRPEITDLHSALQKCYDDWMA